MFDAFLNSVPLLITIAVIALFRSRGKLPANTSEVAAFLAFKIVVPVLLFQFIVGAVLGLESLGLLAISILAVPFLFLAGKLLTKLFKGNSATLASLHISQFDFYVYGFAMPFIIGNFSEEVIANIIIIDLGIFISFLIIGPLIAASYSQTSASFRGLIKDNLLKSELFWVVIISLILNALNFQIPVQVNPILSFFTASFGFLVAILIGSAIKLPNPQQLGITIGTYGYRMLAVTIFILVVLAVFPFGANESLALWLTLTVPVGTFGILFVKQYDHDQNLYSQIHLTSIIISIVLYPLLIILLKWFYL